MITPSWTVIKEDLCTRNGGSSWPSWLFWITMMEMTQMNCIFSLYHYQLRITLSHRLFFKKTHRFKIKQNMSILTNFVILPWNFTLLETESEAYRITTNTYCIHLFLLLKLLYVLNYMYKNGLNINNIVLSWKCIPKQKKYKSEREEHPTKV